MKSVAEAIKAKQTIQSILCLLLLRYVFVDMDMPIHVPADTFLFALMCASSVCVCVCIFVMYGSWKLTAEIQSRCQVAAGNMKVSLGGEGTGQET